MLKIISQVQSTCRITILHYEETSSSECTVLNCSKSFIYNKVGLIPHCASSLPSPQSSLKSHILLTFTHTRLEHVNVFGGHDSWDSEGQKVKGGGGGINRWIDFCHHLGLVAVSYKPFQILIYFIPGREQLRKAMSSIAMSPSSLKVLVASKITVKTWWVRPTATSARCHLSPWSPDFHHIGVFLRPSWRNTFNSPIPADRTNKTNTLLQPRQLHY